MKKEKNLFIIYLKIVYFSKKYLGREKREKKGEGKILGVRVVISVSLVGIK